MTGNEISQITFSLILSHYGGKGHRPRWIASGVLFSALACFVLASPHFIFGSGHDALSFTKEYSYLADAQDDSLGLGHIHTHPHGPGGINMSSSMFSGEYSCLQQLQLQSCS